MTEDDRKAFTEAFVKLCCAYDRSVDSTQCAAWFEFLEDLPLGAVTEAIKAAPRESGRYFPTVGLVGKLAIEARGAGRGQQSATTPGWRCEQCDGAGWVARMTATGETLTAEGLREWERHRAPGARPDGQPHYRKRRCPCKAAQSHGRAA